MKILLISTHSGAGLFCPCGSQWELRDVLVRDIPVCSASDPNNEHSAPNWSWVEGAELPALLLCLLVGFHQPVWGDRMGRSDRGLSLSLASVPKFPSPANT